MTRRCARRHANTTRYIGSAFAVFEHTRRGEEKMDWIYELASMNFLRLDLPFSG
jgi:hypothetical protein